MITYSFPGQFVSTNIEQNTFFKEFGGDKALNQGNRRGKNYVRFDPTTEEIEAIDNL